MIDVENIVINKIIDELTMTDMSSLYGDIVVMSEETKTPSSFPAVMILEKSNSSNLASRDRESKENHANVMYQVDVYDNDVNNKKSRCKAISSKIDEEMQKMGFTRTFSEPITNIEDATIYRITMRYNATISKNINDKHYVYDN